MPESGVRFIENHGSKLDENTVAGSTFLGAVFFSPVIIPHDASHGTKGIFTYTFTYMNGGSFMVNVGKYVPVPWMRHGIGKLCVVSMAVGLIQLAVGFDLCPNLLNDSMLNPPTKKTPISSQSFYCHKIIPQETSRLPC